MTRKAAPLCAFQESRHPGIKAATIWRRRVAGVFVIQESLFDITSVNASKKISAAIAMAAQVIMTLIAIVEEVADVRLPIVELLEVNVVINPILLCMPSLYKRFALSLCHLRQMVT